MANLSKSAIPLLLSLSLLSLSLLSSPPPAMAGGKVGGRKPVKNVQENKEVQDLGRYCVQEYNHRMQGKGNGGGAAAKLLVFSQVVAAETQVVSGIKYFLKISAAPRGGASPKTFEAVVVVKPWLHSKELIDFAPSPPPTSTK